LQAFPNGLSTLCLTLTNSLQTLGHQGDFIFFFKLGKLDTQWVEENKVNPSRPLSFFWSFFHSPWGHFSRAVKIWVRGTLAD